MIIITNMYRLVGTKMQPAGSIAAYIVHSLMFKPFNLRNLREIWAVYNKAKLSTDIF